MEDKMIKVRCIDKRFSDNLTINKEYEVLEETENRYRIINNEKGCTLYPKELFKKVENVLMVECIDNEEVEEKLSIGKTYPVIEEKEDRYVMINDKAYKAGYYKTRFKPVEPQKEVKGINYEEEYYKLNDKIRDLQEEVKIYYDLAKERSDYGNLKKENEEKSNLIIKIRTEKDNQIEKLGAQTTMLELDNNKLKDENTKLNNGMKLLQSENDEYIEALEKVRADNGSLADQVKRLGKSTDNYYYNWIECQEDNKKIKAEAKKLKEDNISMLDDLVECEEKIKKLKETIKNITELI